MNKKNIFILVAIIGLSLSSSLRAQTQNEILQKIDRYVQKAMSDWGSPGLAVGIVKDDSIIFAKGYGIRELGKPEKVDEYTLFSVGSQTKSFTAAALAMLVDEKKLKWDDPVIKYLPEFQLSDPWITRDLTIRDCLTHRVGFEPLIMPWILTNHDRNELLRRYRYARPVHRFRSAFNYNNEMFLLAGQIIPAVTGKSWEAFIKERIFEPLRMTTSNTSITEFTNGANRTLPHAIIDGKIQAIPWGNMDNIGPAGSINSSVMDMTQWLRMQLGNGSVEGKRVLSPDSMKEMHSPQQIITSIQQWSKDPRISLNAIPLLKSRFETYGLGWFVQDYRGCLIVHHGGEAEGMRCQTGMIPELDLGVVIFSNLHPSTLVEALMIYVFDAFIGGETRDWSGEILTMVNEFKDKTARSSQVQTSQSAARTSPAFPLENYTGLYENDLYGQALVTSENNQLKIQLGQVESLLIPRQANAFLISEPIMYVGRMPVYFIPNKEGVIHQFKLLGIIDFRRVPEH